MPSFLTSCLPILEIFELEGCAGTTISMELRLACDTDSRDTLMAERVGNTVVVGYLLHDHEHRDPMQENDAQGELLYWGYSGDRDQDRHDNANSMHISLILGLEQNDGHVERDDEWVPRIDQKVTIDGHVVTLFDLAFCSWYSAVCEDNARLQPYFDEHEITLEDWAVNDWLKVNRVVLMQDAGDVNGTFYEEITIAARAQYPTHWRAFVDPGVVLITPNLGHQELWITVHDTLDWDGDYTDTGDIPSLWIPDDNVLANLKDKDGVFKHEDAVLYAKSVCSEYVSAMNGDCWGRVILQGEIDVNAPEALIRYEDKDNLDGEVWGFIGIDYAKDELKGDFNARIDELKKEHGL